MEINMVRDMTKGEPLRLLIAFSIPLIIGTLFQQTYSIVDTAIVGRLIGKQALAAVGATGSITFFIIGFINGMAEGACILVAQHFGSGDTKSLKRCVGNIIYVSIAVVAVITALALTFNETILTVMKTPSDIIGDAKAYLTVIYSGMFATMLYNVLAGLLRALGDSRSPLYFLIVASLLNVILDVVFIAGFKMGVEGAAYATVLSQLISALCCFVYIMKKCGVLHLSADDLKFRGKMAVKIILMGLPMGLQNSVTAIGSILVQRAVNPLGSDCVVAVSLASRINDIFCVTLSAVGASVANYCGQNIGFGRLDRVRQGIRKSLIIMLFISVIAFVVCGFFGEALGSLFLNDASKDVLSLVGQSLRILSPTFFALGVLFSLRCAIQGLGYSLHAMLAGTVELVARGGVALGFVGKYGYVAVCFSNPVAWVSAALFLILLYVYVIGRVKRLHPEW